MSGLVQNNFYSMESNIRFSFLISFALIFAPLFIGEPTLLSMVIAMQVFVFVVNTGTSLHADEAAKWTKFEITLPVNRSTIIGAKYISFAILILLGFMMSIFTCVVAFISGLAVTADSLIFGFEFGLTLSITSTALMYPAMLKLGAEKNELILFISASISVFIMLLIALLLAPVTQGMYFRHPFSGAISTLASLLIFLASYFVSLKIHRNKEF